MDHIGELRQKKWTRRIITNLLIKKQRCPQEREKRRKFEKEFKIDAVKLVTERGMKVTEVSRDLGISKELLYRWKNDYEKSGTFSFPGEGNLNPEDEELRKLRRELANVKEERDILKKAIAIFSKEPNPNTSL